jgi:hypothetical protein
MAAPTIKVLLCLSMFVAVHRRPDNLKAFTLQFRFGSFQTHQGSSAVHPKFPLSAMLSRIEVARSIDNDDNARWLA